MNTPAVSTETLIARVREWIAIDPDPHTRSAAESLLAQLLRDPDSESLAREVSDAFLERLDFGTAGIRGHMGAGIGRMNRVVVTQASAGVAEFLLQRAEAGLCASPPHVVIGYDARDKSREFAEDSAEIFAGYGVRVSLLSEPCPTPVTAFAVRQLAASAGVMITASHNPPRDNGYKLYLGDADAGSQIVSPDDQAIRQLTHDVSRRPLSDLPRSQQFETLGAEIVEAYVAAAAKQLSGHIGGDEARVSSDLRIVYTAMHGVGASAHERVFQAAGLAECVPVVEQRLPDCDFPTLQYPNPEEPGALDLAIHTAHAAGADVIIAHDPDADRLGVVARTRGSGGAESGTGAGAAVDSGSAGFQRLTGNEIGLLLGWQAAKAAQQNGMTGALANTLVSSPALGAVAQHYGFDFVQTLSGAKWLSRVPNLIFAFEEALGYLVCPDLVRDKDGITAGAVLAALAHERHAAGSTLWEALDEAHMLFGHFASRQIVLRFDHVREAARFMAAIRSAPPQRFGPFAVDHMHDLLKPETVHNSEQPGHQGSQPGLPQADVLRFDLAADARVMLRPSGTEPKLKVYLHAWSSNGSLSERKSEVAQRLGEMEAAAHAMLTAAGSSS